MMCKKCGKEFSPTKGLKSYCSLECRNSRVRTEDTKRKIRSGVISWQQKLASTDPEAWRLYRLKIAEGTKRRFQNKEGNRLRYLTEMDFDKIGPDSKRDKVILDQNGKCAKCHTKEWFNQPLTLEIDHINGDHRDNRRENLVALCPNCHSITPTWRGRNKPLKKKIPDDVVINALKSEPTIRQAIIKCGLSPRGNNYIRFSRLKNGLMADR